MSLEDFEQFDGGGAENSEKQAEKIQEKAREKARKAKATWQQEQKREQRAKKRDVDLSHFIITFLQSHKDSNIIRLVVILLQQNFAASILVVTSLLVYKDELKEKLENPENFHLLQNDISITTVEIEKEEKKYFHANTLPHALKQEINYWIADILQIVKEFPSIKKPFIINKLPNPTFQELLIRLLHRKLQQFNIDTDATVSKERIAQFCGFLVQKIVNADKDK